MTPLLASSTFVSVNLSAWMFFFSCLSQDHVRNGVFVRQKEHFPRERLLPLNVDVWFLRDGALYGPVP